MKKRLTMMVATLSFFAVAMPLWADDTNDTPTVTDVVAKQRYPWNGLVDICCTVTGIAGETNGLKFAVSVVMPDSGNTRNVSHFYVVQGGTNSTDREVYRNGNYRLIWDAKADLGNVICSNMVVRVNLDAHEKVQLWEGGPYWATTNIGAEEPEDYGYYFWWGDTVGYRLANDAWVATDGSSENFSFGSSNTPTYGKDIATLQSEGWITGDNVLAPEHDAAQVQWGGGWRMPTYQELTDLNNKCDWVWTMVNGVNGYRVTGKGDYSANSIFLPAAGYGYGDSLGYYRSSSSLGSHGFYWSSIKGPYDSAICDLHFTSSSHGSNNSFYRARSGYGNYNNSGYCGFSVRPVQWGVN